MRYRGWLSGRSIGQTRHLAKSVLFADTDVVGARHLVSARSRCVVGCSFVHSSVRPTSSTPFLSCVCAALRYVPASCVFGLSFLAVGPTPTPDSDFLHLDN